MLGLITVFNLEKMINNKKAQWLTRNKKHRAESAKFERYNI